jgi:hypothetical protein
MIGGLFVQLTDAGNQTTTMDRGLLVQLLAVGNQNTATGVRNVAHDYHTYESRGLSPVIIGRIADIVIPEYLELHFSDTNRFNLQDIKKLTLNMEIGGQKIQQFPLSLLVNLNDPILCDDKMYINLCFDMLFGELKMIGLQYHEVRFLFSRDNDLSCISRYGIVSKITYLDTQERRNLAQNSCEDIIQQFSFIDVKTDINDSSQASDSYELRLPFNSISKGFFIECENVDNLNNIYLRLNEGDRFNLNRFLIRTKCKKINQNLLYFPFNYGKEFTERNAQSFEGSPNFSLIDMISLTLKFDTAINNVKIYSLQSNIYRQRSGMGGLAYDSELSNGVFDLRNNPLQISQGQVYVSNADYNTRNPRPPTVGTSITYSEPITNPILDVNASNCPILCEPIVIGARYMSCHQCVNNFSEQALKRWLESRRPSQRTCPGCRVQWTNFEIYINSALDPPTTT